MMPHVGGGLKSRPKVRCVPGPRSPLILGVVALGGAVGAVGRYGIAEAIPWSGQGFPWATFITNVIGCLVIGALVVWLVEQATAPPWLRPLLVTGVLGGFTTYSTFALELRDLLAADQSAMALGYLIATLVVGIAAVSVTRTAVVRSMRSGDA
jgi:CrcB protein